ncbi:MAG: sensor histidine kinase [Alphaproteobacteria bacterium]
MLDREAQAHLGALAVLIGAGAYLNVRLDPVLPALNAAISMGALVVTVGIWLTILGLRYLPGPVARKSRETWRRQDRTLTWTVIGALILRFWLCMPYAEEPLRLLSVMALCGASMILVLGTVAPPPLKPPLVYEHLVLPLALIPYFVVYPDAISPLVILYLLGFSGVVYLISLVLKNAFRGAYADRLASESALRQLAAEREGKTRFLASAWHDLGQPLQAARLSFDQVLRTGDNVQREGAARRVTWAFDTTEQLLHQILDHLRLDAGALTPRSVAVALGPLMSRIAELNEQGARLAGADLHVLASRLKVLADPGLCERIVANLLVNSIRHARARRIVIGARRRGACVRLWVIDDGGGIPPSDVAGLFEEYVQGSNHGDEIRGGFGLGLASSRRQARLMGGDVGLDTSWCKGSAFWLDLPAAE